MLAKISPASKSSDKRSLFSIIFNKMPFNKLKLYGNKSFSGRAAYLEKIAGNVSENLKLSKAPLYLILLDVTLFSPYYPLETKRIAAHQEKKIRDLKPDDDTFEGSCRQAAIILGIDEGYVDVFRNAYRSAYRSLTGFWKKVLLGGLAGALLVAITAGVAAPAIGALFAGAGLHGAAAVSAGLAFLGGGAVAVGGFGVLGGTVVVVGGGALLGAGAGTAIGSMIASMPQFALNQAAKLEVVMREIVMGQPRDAVLAQQILEGQEQTIRNRVFMMPRTGDRARLPLVRVS